MLAQIRISHVIAGIIAVLVGYAGSAAIIFQASETAGATPAQATSWMLALGVGCAISSAYLSLKHKVPVLTAWSTPGAALLVTALPGTPLAEATGAFIFCGALLFLTGVTGLFERLAMLIPDALANAMLAGVLFQFGVNVFAVLPDAPALSMSMALTYFVARRYTPRAAVPLVLMVGVLWVGATGEFGGGADIDISMARPEWVSPTFSLATLIGIGVPLYIVTMSSQNMAGVAVLRGVGYTPPISSALSVTGALSLLLAPFGGFALNLAAITAAICAGEEAGADPKARYWAPVFASLMYLLFALFGAAVIGFFLAAPEALIVVLAGLALLPTITTSLSAALQEQSSREAAIVTFLVAASGVNVVGIAAPVLGLVAGGGVWMVRKR